MLWLQSRLLAVGVVVGVVAAGPALVAGQTTLTKEQMKQFLLTAEVVDSTPIGKGVTDPWRLTLSDGQTTHDAAFQSVNQRETVQRLGRTRELNFVDAYWYNIAAFGLAELLGLDDMVPVTVERTWRGQKGALSWWIDASLDEAERLKQRIWPADMEAWSQQMYRLLVFDQLIRNTDRNQGNILYTEDWKLWMIDFSRAFRIWDSLENPEDVGKCDRQLFERLQQLSATDVERNTRPHLSEAEIRALLARRDKLVAHFQKLISQKGEHSVLY